MKNFRINLTKTYNQSKTDQYNIQLFDPIFDLNAYSTNSFFLIFFFKLKNREYSTSSPTHQESIAFMYAFKEGEESPYFSNKKQNYLRKTIS